ncbi:glycosyl hydrolase family 18 protein [Amycolatopsis benzoatilytica]|uniref:glycosyl hydrolase family 18 protein n=1 Tax=Amycolatopsis benzoatilytica TaxID=346045 RepID=UPI00036B8B74|nr:glycosyl hydrolase family 18 protein [Amycolatopsis benzoatilytica]
MRRRRHLSRWSALLAAAAAPLGVLVATAGPATAATPLPNHVFAPYFESWNGESPAAMAQDAGVQHLTMAFLQAATKGQCTVYWNGDSGMPVADSTFGADIRAIRSRGGDVIPSFGGYTADNTGTEIADSCTNADQIAAAYESVVTTYDVPRLDMDVEDNSLTDSAGIDRRNKAIKKVQDWAAASGRQLQISYTLPTTTSGLASALGVLENAVSNGTRVDVVNLMTFDYYDNASHQMAQDTQTAAAGLVSQLGRLYPDKTEAQLWAMVGITEMPGIDDFGAAETFTTADATAVYDWAASKGINELSFWALQRDNGGCPGTGGSDTCSGIAQDKWYFSHTFAPFTGGTPVPGNDSSVSASPSSASVDPGGAASAKLTTAVTSGTAEQVSFAVSGAPAGVAASVSPGTVTAGDSATLSITTTAAAQPGVYPLTVTGTTPSGGSRTATYTLTVNGTSPAGTVSNGNFETGALGPWTGAGDTVVSSPVHSGSHALKVSPTAATTGEAAQNLTLAPNHAYTLTAWVQGGYAYAGVRGDATASDWTSQAAWTQLTVPFKTGSTGAVTVYLHGWYGQAPIYADDVSVS